MRRSTSILVLVSIFWMFTGARVICAQGFGGFGGAGNLPGHTNGTSEGNWNPASELWQLPPENALNFITIDGTAELRTVPEEIRVVLAITSEAETANECQKQNADLVQAVLKAWTVLNINEKNIVEDFINVLPVYEWRLDERDGKQFRIQQRKGYRMQTNLHVSVKTEKDAMAAIDMAFKEGVTDIVTFDYWSSKLNEQKVKARAAALEAAKEKSETLLAVFAEPPKIINIQERTAVFLPHSLYRTYQNVLEEEVEYNASWRDTPAIKAFRPKMTFFQGLQSRSDVRPSRVAMRPEIAVVSSVRLYYQSPADKTVVSKRD